MEARLNHSDEVPTRLPTDYILAGVMHSVDKWLEGDELEQDEINRAATMRAKTLKIVEDLEKKLAESEEQLAESKRLLTYYDDNFGNLTL